MEHTMLALFLSLLLAGVPVRANTTVERDAEGWAVVAVRAADGHEATCRLPLAAPPEDPDAPPHAGLAGAEAWLAVAREALAAEDWEPAVEAARRGIGELGRRYGDPLAVDDTGLKLKAAEAGIEEGRVADGARQLAGVLEARIALYRAHHGL